MRDIEDIDDIKVIVDEFYKKVQNDNLLAPVFALRITDWQPHLNTMYNFWNAALFQVKGYVGNPMAKHITLPVEAPHFQRWINLFYETIDQHFKGPVADEAKQRSMIMAHTIFQRIHGE
jgi:hemoglobin